MNLGGSATTHPLGARAIYIVGNCIVDLVMPVVELPTAGQDVTSTGSFFACGGGGYNSAVAAKRQGAEVRFLGQRGTGPFAAIAQAALDEAGITALLPANPHRDNGFDVALVDASGERTFVTTVGAESELNRAALATITPLAHELIAVSGYTLASPANTAAILELLERAEPGAVIAWDPGPYGSALDDRTFDRLAEALTLVSCNEAEALALTGHEHTAAAIQSLSATFPHASIIIRQSSKGCLVLERGIPPVVVPGFAVHQRDANGAGDAHFGALLAALAEGLPLLHAAERANAAAALAVTRSGPATSPTRDELDVFLQEQQRQVR